MIHFQYKPAPGEYREKMNELFLGNRKYPAEEIAYIF